MRFVLLLGLMFCSITAQAWDCRRHQVIAEIAYQSLDQETRQYWLKILWDSQIFYHSRPLKSFRAAACWPDWIKMDGMNQYDSWHFVDIPFEQGSNDGIIPSTKNILSALNQAQSTLTNREASAYDKGFALCFMIHLVGDIHQPLHCISRYGDRFPEGDRGGNLYQIRVDRDQYESLHRLWDQGLAGQQAWNISTKAQQLMQKCPSLDTEINFELWARQSYDLARTWVYRTPYGGQMTNTYLYQSHQLIDQQLVLAGYRLAQVLRTVH